MDYTDYSSGADYSSTDLTGAENALFGGLSAGMLIFVLALAVLSIIGMWKIFTKAGKPGWASLIPFYNSYVLLQIVGRPTWWILLFLAAFIPFIGWIPAVVAAIIVTNDLAKSFGKDVAWTLFLIFLSPIAYIMLGFGDAKYQGPSVKPAPAGGAPAAPVSSGSPTSPAAGAPASPAASPQSPSADDANKPNPPQVQ